MKGKVLTATLLASLAAPANAGGPVMIEDETDVVAERPASSMNPVIPLLLLIVLAAAASGGSSAAGDDGNSNSSETGD